MDQIKKQLFWIVLGVLMLGAVILYFMELPDVDTARGNAMAKAKELQERLNEGHSATNPDKILTPTHRKAIQDYLKAAEAEKAAEIALWKGKQLELRFPDIPDAKKNPIGFDNWLGKLRDKLKDKMTAAGVKPPDNYDKLTFSDSGVEDGSAEIHRHSDYRLRYMAVFEEVVDALCSKPGTEEVRTFEPEPAKDEPKQQKPVGPIELIGFTLHMPEDEATARQKEYEHVLTLSGRSTHGMGPAANAGFVGLAMPLKVTGIDVEFTAHFSALAGVTRKLEATSRYFAIVTKTDCERSASLFPGPLNDTKTALDYAKPTFNPFVNSHFGEGPMHALVSFEIYEYDATKGKDLESNKVPVKPPPVVKKK